MYVHLYFLLINPFLICFFIPVLGCWEHHFTDDNKFEVEINSDTHSEIQKLIPNVENYHRELQKVIDDILDQRVAKTDMKLRHIVTKGIEVKKYIYIIQLHFIVVSCYLL